MTGLQAFAEMRSNIGHRYRCNAMPTNSFVTFDGTAYAWIDELGDISDAYVSSAMLLADTWQCCGLDTEAVSLVDELHRMADAAMSCTTEDDWSPEVAKAYGDGLRAAARHIQERGGL